MCTHVLRSPVRHAWLPLWAFALGLLHLPSPVLEGSVSPPVWSPDPQNEYTWMPALPRPNSNSRSVRGVHKAHQHRWDTTSKEGTSTCYDQGQEVYPGMTHLCHSLYQGGRITHVILSVSLGIPTGRLKKTRVRMWPDGCAHGNLDAMCPCPKPALHPRSGSMPRCTERRPSPMFGHYSHSPPLSDRGGRCPRAKLRSGEDTQRCAAHLPVSLLRETQHLPRVGRRPLLFENR